MLSYLVQTKECFILQLLESLIGHNKETLCFFFIKMSKEMGLVNS